MTRYVALLRGINVGGNNKVPMAGLRRSVESLGYREVSTYIQSGNVIFDADTTVGTTALESAIARDFGIEVAVVVRDGDELRRILDAGPFAAAQGSHLHVGFMAVAPPAEATASLDPSPFLPDEFAVAGREIYLHLPDGMARTKLPAYLGRQLKVPITLRNWNTVTKLVELTSA